MNEHIRFIYDGILNIPLDYFYCETREGRKQYNERVFCYELYHQLRILMPKYLTQINKRLDGEIPKVLRYGSPPYFGIEYAITDKERDFKAIPDMVIHENQKNRKGQYLILEVKNSPNKVNVKWDLIKILSYIEQLKYEIGIYLQVNHLFNELKEQIKESFDQKQLQEEDLWDEYFKKTIIMTANVIEKEICIEQSSLYEILKCKP